MTTLAPIVLFVYNRPNHTKLTVGALKKNHLASESELFIYSDAPKNNATLERVKEVRAYINSIGGFKEVTITYRDRNWGLANSIIDGVTKSLREYGKVIVLEDDLVTSPYFLKFMNDALDTYQDNKKVWHISGWNYPISLDDIEDTFCWRVMNCWGWATWEDRWRYYRKDVHKVISEFSSDDIKIFNLDGAENFWSQLVANKEGRINTWAIFWYATIVKQQGLCLNPAQTFVDNIGIDGSGMHCDASDAFSSKLSLKKDIRFTDKIFENEIAVSRIKSFYQGQSRSLFLRSIEKLSRLVQKSNLKK